MLGLCPSSATSQQHDHLGDYWAGEAGGDMLTDESVWNLSSPIRKEGK